MFSYTIPHTAWALGIIYLQLSLQKNKQKSPGQNAAYSLKFHFHVIEAKAVWWYILKGTIKYFK